MKTAEKIATVAAVAAALGYPLFTEHQMMGDMLISVTDDGRYGPGGAEGDLVKAQAVAELIPGAYVVACGVVAWDT